MRPCATRWALSLAAENEVKACVIAALEYGRRLGLDDQAWAIDDATREPWR